MYTYIATPYSVIAYKLLLTVLLHSYVILAQPLLPSYSWLFLCIAARSTHIGLATY